MRPEPLAWLGLGMSMSLVGLHTLGAFAVSAPMVAMVVFAGAVASLIGAVAGGRRHDTFALTAFAGLSLWWASFAWVLLATSTTDITTWDTPAAVGWYFMVWTFFALLLAVAGARRSHVSLAVYGTFAATLLLLAAGAFTRSEILARFGGATAIFHAIVAFYAGAAVLLQSVFGRPILPVGDKPNMVVPDTPASLMDWDG